MSKLKSEGLRDQLEELQVQFRAEFPGYSYVQTINDVDRLYP
jgi:hypothetical protein